MPKQFHELGPDLYGIAVDDLKLHAIGTLRLRYEQRPIICQTSGSGKIC
jgi:hypothetical protein